MGTPRPSRNRPLVWRVLRGVGWAVVSLILALVLGVFGAILAARTDWGHRKLLAWVLPQVSRALNGRLSIDTIDGSLTRDLELSKVLIFTVDGKAAVQAERIRVRYDLLALLHHRLHIEHLEVDGLALHVRRDQGVINLATLLRPSQPSPHPMRIDLDQIRASVAADFVDTKSDDWKADVRGTLEGAVESHGGAVTVSLAQFVLDSHDPVAAHLELAGRCNLDEGSVSFHAVRADVRSTGESINRLLSSSTATRLRGPLQLTAHLDGPLTGAKGRVVVSLPKGAATIEAQVGARDGLWIWSGAVEANAIDPRALVVGAPTGEITLNARGQGVDGRGHIDALHFLAQIAGAHAELDGNLSLDGTGAADLRVLVPDLSRLSGLGAPDLRGRVNARAHLAFREFFPLGSLDVVAPQFAAGGVHLSDVRLHAKADLHRFSMQLAGSARGSQPTSVWMDLAGRPILRDGKPVGVDATLAALRLRFRGKTWQTTAPAHVVVGDEVRVEHFHLASRLASDEQTLALQGRVRLRSATGGRPVDATLTTHALDLREIGLALGMTTLPRTSLETHVQVHGTIEAPVATLGLTGAVQPSEGGPKVNLDVEAHYANRRATLKLGAQNGSATLRANIDAPIGPLRLLRTGQTHVDAELTHVDFEKLDLDSWGIHSPFHKGQLTARISLDGNLSLPVLHAELDVQDLAKPGTIEKLGAQIRADYATKTAHATARITLEGPPILVASAESHFDLLALLGQPETWREIRLAAEGTIPAFDLQRLRRMQPQLEPLRGALRAKIGVAGTLGSPQASLDANIDQLAFAEIHFPRCTLHASVEEQKASVTLDAQQETGGILHGQGDLALGATRQLDAKVKAQRFDLGFLAAATPLLRRVVGKLDAELHFAGPITSPEVRGLAQIEGGSVTMAIDGHTYDKLRLVLALERGKATLRELAVHSGDGWLRAHGDAQLDGVKPQRFDVEAETHHFGLSFGQLAAWLDADLGVHGQSATNRLLGTVVVHRGSVQIPKLDTGPNLQSTAPMKHVVFTDQQARREKIGKANQLATQVAIHVPGPVYVRSSTEARLDLNGDVELQAKGGLVTLSGNVQTGSGFIELFGRRYEIERARVSFDGAPENPALDVRVTRQTGDAKIAIEVHGTGRKPRLALSSDPPIYDESQIVGIILSGDPGGQHTSERSLDSKVVGAMTGLVVQKLKNQLIPKLPIDVVKVDTGGEDYAGLAQTRLEVGKYLTDNLYLSYVHQFGGNSGFSVANANEARLEYRFLKRFELDTTVGDAGMGNLDLYWTLRY